VTFGEKGNKARLKLGLGEELTSIPTAQQKQLPLQRSVPRSEARPGPRADDDTDAPEESVDSPIKSAYTAASPTLMG